MASPWIHLRALHLALVHRSHSLVWRNLGSGPNRGAYRRHHLRLHTGKNFIETINYIFHKKQVACRLFFCSKNYITKRLSKRLEVSAEAFGFSHGDAQGGLLSDPAMRGSSGPLGGFATFAIQK